MKILMMTNTYFPLVGGIEQSIRSFCDEFRRLGHDVLIAAPLYEGRAEDEEQVIRVPAFRKFYKTDFSINLPVPGFLPKIMKTFSPDIVHSHHPFFMGDLALRLSRQYHRPLVFTYHIMVEEYVHYLPIQNEGVKRFVIEIATGYANLADQVIVPTASVRDILLQRGVNVPVETIPTGINLEQFSKGDGQAFRLRHQIPAWAFVIGYVGRLGPEKNLDFLVNGLIRVLKKEPQAHVVIVGYGPSQAAIQKAFEEAGLQQRLHLTGILYSQDLVNAYAAMDVFAFASLSETQGVVLLEAMACAVPVVAVDAPGVREVVRDSFNGRLIRELDLQEFVDAVLWSVHCAAERWQAIKRQALATARGYSIHSCARHMLEIYERLRAGETTGLQRNDSSWYMLKSRLKAEWELFKNLMEAGEAAMLEAASLGEDKRARREKDDF